MLAQTCQFPLAIATDTGEIRQRPKSSIREAFFSDPKLASLFSTSCPVIGRERDGNFDFIIDFLRTLHQPPPPHVENLEDFAKYIWDYAVVTLGFSRGAARVTMVIDKPQYLPPPRALLHTSRQKKLAVSATSRDVEFPCNWPSPSWERLCMFLITTAFQGQANCICD